MRVRTPAGAIVLVALLGVTIPVTAQAPDAGSPVPTPESHFGFEIGTDRQLASWTELSAYYERVADASPRVTLDTLGQTVLGRPFLMMTTTSPANHDRLEELRDIQLRLADPRRISGPEERERLLEEGRAVVLITHAIHSTEVGSAQSAARLAYRLASSDEERIREILDEVILLHVPNLNPDGTEMVVDWYDEWLGTQHEAAPLPFLYHHYTGHDNNRDWYAFTQPETRHTIRDAHNAWHPQIIHDIHQMGGDGARIFFPPFVDPFEPNIDPAIVSAGNQLGAYQAAELIGEGKKGVVINAIYDAFTPARAYQHYHGGVRILSETASARLATPDTLELEALERRRNFDPRKRSWNFPTVWEGGEWGLPQIVDYMTSGALALLSNAAKNRRFWLENFHGINRRAVEKWPEWPDAWILPAGQENRAGLKNVLWILRMGDVEVHRVEEPIEAGGRRFSEGSWVVPMVQPYASFAQTLLERQDYPTRLQYPGGPPERPYDATAHTLPLLMDVEAVPVSEAPRLPLSDPIPVPELGYPAPPELTGPDAPRIAFYKSWREPMTAGWTRWVLDVHGIAYDTLHDEQIRAGGLADRYDVLLLEDQTPESIGEGWSADRMPERYTGGLGAAGGDAIREFVREGGRIVAIERAADYAIRTLSLRTSSTVTGLPPEEFYIPGSILRLDVTEDDPLARGIDPASVAWFWRSSRAFDVRDPDARIIARYASAGNEDGSPLLSGWAVGGERLTGEAALIELSAGEGSAVLFGFPPNYRGQTRATWPLLFNALAGR